MSAQFDNYTPMSAPDGGRTRTPSYANPMGIQPTYGYNPPSAKNDYVSTATDIASIGAGAGTAAGFLTGGTGFLLAAGIRLVGGIIGSMARHKRPRSSQEVYFDNMVNFYSDLGKKSQMARGVASMFTGRPASSFTNIETKPSVIAKRTRYTGVE